MLIGTHTSDNDNNYVQIATVHLPKPRSELQLEKYDDERGGASPGRPLPFLELQAEISPYSVYFSEIGAHTATEPRIKVIHSINHTGEVNRARYMPQNPDLIATKTVMGEVYIFDRTKHPSSPSSDVCKPDITLRGHTKEGCVAGLLAGSTRTQELTLDFMVATACRGTRRQESLGTS